MRAIALVTLACAYACVAKTVRVQDGDARIVYSPADVLPAAKCQGQPSDAACVDHWWTETHPTGSTIHDSFGRNVSLSFAFQGTAIRMFGTTLDQGAQAVVTIDGTTTLANFASPDRKLHDSVQVYELGGLDGSVSHTLTVAFDPDSFGPATDRRWLGVDFFEYDVPDNAQPAAAVQNSATKQSTSNTSTSASSSNQSILSTSSTVSHPNSASTASQSPSDTTATTTPPSNSTSYPSSPAAASASVNWSQVALIAAGSLGGTLLICGSAFWLWIACRARHRQPRDRMITIETGMASLPQQATNITSYPFTTAPNTASSHQHHRRASSSRRPRVQTDRMSVSYPSSSSRSSMELPPPPLPVFRAPRSPQSPRPTVFRVQNPDASHGGSAE